MLLFGNSDEMSIGFIVTLTTPGVIGSTALVFIKINGFFLTKWSRGKTTNITVMQIRTFNHLSAPPLSRTGRAEIRRLCCASGTRGKFSVYFTLRYHILAS